MARVALCLVTLYIRVSSQEQAAGDRYSLPEQERRLRAYCAERGYEIAGVYQDIQSGRRDDRRAYQEMLAQIRAGGANVVLVRWLDRFGRHPREILSRIWELQDLGVQVECTDEDIGEELILLVRAAMAGKESERISARVIPPLRARAEEGKWSGVIAYGMRYGQDGRPEPDPRPECHAIDLIYQAYDPHGSLRFSLVGVAVYLHQLGYRAPGGGRWRASTIRKVLRNPIYAGILMRSGVTVPDNHPGRVSLDVWERCQERLGTRRFNRVTPAERPDVIGAGLVYCECGARMSMAKSAHGPYCYFYFRCPRHHQTRECPVGTVSASVIEAWLREKLRNWPSSPDLDREVETALRRHLSTDSRDGLSAASEQLRRLQAKRQRLLDDRADGLITRDEFAAAIGPLRQEIADAESRVRGMQRDARDIDELICQTRGILALLRAGPLAPADLRAIVAFAVERITVRADRTFEFTWRPGMEDLFGSRL